MTALPFRYSDLGPATVGVPFVEECQFCHCGITEDDLIEMRGRYAHEDCAEEMSGEIDDNEQPHPIND